MIVAQNLVLNIGDWTELHGICVLKTAPKVSKRKTRLEFMLCRYSKYKVSEIKQ